MIRLWLTLILFTGNAFVFAAETSDTETIPTPTPWEPDVVQMFKTIPIQEGGRIKPISTYAGFLLLRLNGKRECRTPDGRRMTPSEWFMDCLLRPQLAQEYPVFLVDDTAVLDAIGVPHEGRKKRDRYTYAELAPARERLMDIAQRASNTPPQQLNMLEAKILRLAQNLQDFEKVIHHFDFARYAYSIPADSPLATLLPEKRFSEIVKKARIIAVAAVALHRGELPNAEPLNPNDEELLRKILPDSLQNLDAETRTHTIETLERLLNEVDTLAARSDALAAIPPPDSETEWLTPGDFVEHAFFSGPLPDALLQMLSLYEELPRAANDPRTFRSCLSSFAEAAIHRAQERGEYKKIPLEVILYDTQPFYYSLILYALCFVLAALTWISPKNRRLAGLAFIAPLIPTALLAYGITLRCIIRGRPPVTTLYETILFATAVAVLIAWIVEWIDRKKIALSIGTLLGAAGMFLAFKYEAKEGVDTMPSLVAVLDTNFWLATHVTTITIGYGAGLLAGAIAHVYIFAKFIGLNSEGADEFYESLTNIVYGVLCFALVFSVLGTVLGGIWAAESWGRFWGWDPKENGALLIVLWQLTILHARKGGYIRELGLHGAAVFQNVVIAFSWWGVNQLGVGLHSYGQTTGIMRALFVFYAVEFTVVAFAIGLWLFPRFSSAQPAVKSIPK
ncbi:MAG TPA: cytochrome c biogenesis protein CcsA [Candidatus Hydrogenedentes bacterium]|nr:cytochrome c biogenesis protein CcsA [Candidatus Hydrogenedentota bacterium]HOL77678.1 cytochrome c biogenesis protein CcsA [Candidatus Hydrogenedentota bacterium]HPO86692.1 cytochrome c biogenesis protein CcsA [Candidatus Hydrogenedentota bacterium]